MENRSDEDVDQQYLKSLGIFVCKRLKFKNFLFLII